MSRLVTGALNSLAKLAFFMVLWFPRIMVSAVSNQEPFLIRGNAMFFYSKNSLPSKEVLPGIVLRSVYLDNSMMTFFDIEPGSRIPPHKHPHEQISYVVKGSMKMTVGGEIRSMREGDIAVIPPNVEHQVETGDEPVLAIDAWHPRRDDYVLDTPSS
jgi:quercetin dioxygenase-like cupin family protein